MWTKKYFAMKIYTVTHFVCKCGYETINAGCAFYHSKKKKSCEKEMTSTKRRVTFADDVQTEEKPVEPETKWVPINTIKDDATSFVRKTKSIHKTDVFDMSVLPGRVLYKVRNAEVAPGVITRKNGKIVELLPDGTTRIMSASKAVRVYALEVLEGILKEMPSEEHERYYMDELTVGKKTASLADAVYARAYMSVKFHHKIPEELQHKVEHMVKFIDQSLRIILDENIALSSQKDI
jgi:hypothetical protein